MHTFTVAEAKAQLSRLIAMVEAGEAVTITKRGQAVVRLVRSSPASQQLPSLAELRARLPEQANSFEEFGTASVIDAVCRYQRFARIHVARARLRGGRGLYVEFR